jgi:hypothetical protein
MKLKAKKNKKNRNKLTNHELNQKIYMVFVYLGLLAVAVWSFYF